MLLKYTEKNVLTIYMPKGETGRDLVNFQILPGINEIENNEWTKIQENKQVKKFIEKGCLVEKSSAGKSEKLGLSDYSPEEARPIIEETYDVALLDKWKLSEERSSIHSLIDKQFEIIDEKTKPKKKDGES